MLRGRRPVSRARRGSHAVDHPVAERARHAEGELAALPIVDDERRVLTRHGGGEAGEDPVQRIGVVRHALEILRRGELGGDRARPLAVCLVEGAAVVAVRELDRAEDALRAAHRHDEPIGAHEAAHRRGQRGLAAGEGVLLQRLGGREDDLVALAVVEEEREALRGGDVLRVLEDDAEDLRQVERGGERLERGVECGYLAELALEDGRGRGYRHAPSR